jgi:hypothetical protein
VSDDTTTDCVHLNTETVSMPRCVVFALKMTFAACIYFCDRRRAEDTKQSTSAAAANDRGKKELDVLQKQIERELEDRKLELLEVCTLTM